MGRILSLYTKQELRKRKPVTETGYPVMRTGGKEMHCSAETNAGLRRRGHGNKKSRLVSANTPNRVPIGPEVD